MSLVKVNNRFTSKDKVKQHYKKQWRKKNFREILKKEGVFTRNSFNGKSVIKRKGVKIKNWKDLEKQINQHAVEIIVPAKNISKSFVDIDIPKEKLKNKRSIIKDVVTHLKKQKIKVKSVTVSPNGGHIHTNNSKNILVSSLKNIEKQDKKFHVGKSSKKKIVLDPYEPNVAVPGSLSIKGKPYKEF